MRKFVIDTRIYRSFGLESDHYLVVCKLRITHSFASRYRKPVKRIKVLRNEMAADEFKNRVEEKFSQVELNVAVNIENEWNIFKKSLLEVAEECLGSNVVKDGKKQTGWWSNEIKEAVKEKRMRYLLWLQNRSSENDRLYKEMKSNVKNLVKKAKDTDWEKFGRDLEHAGQQRNKVFWTNIKNIRNGDKKQAPVGVVDSSGNPVLGFKNILNRWKNYFSDLFNCGSSLNNDIDSVENTISESNVEISVAEIELGIRNLKWGKAAGVDEIRNEYLMYSGSAGTKWLHRIFNLAWSSSVVPSDWTGAVISPIHKKGDNKTCSNYRGISLLSVVGKVYAAIIEKRTRSIVEHLLDENQSGFRPMRGCQDQIFCLRQIMEKFHEKNKDLYLAFVDLEKAYDSVPRSKLWSVLAEYGVNGKLLEAIKSLYVNCRAAVRIDGRLSEWFDVKNGVRQGCTISPLLFIIYMDKLIKVSNLKGKVVLGNNDISSLAYADDLSLCGSSEEELQSNCSI